MSLEDTLERPEPKLATSAGWQVIGHAPALASQDNYPVVAQRNGVIYVFGGDAANGVLTSSDNAATWTSQTGDWPARAAASGVLHDGRFYLVGGFSPGRGFSDTLVSDDAVHFSQVGADAPAWGVRWAHTLLSSGGKLLMIAGVAGPDYSDQVWALDTQAADPQWAKIAEGQFASRAWAAGAVLGDKLLVIGGWNEPDGAFAETLVSTDGGATWTVNPAPFTPRHSAAAITIGDTVYLVGGCTGRPGTTFYSDVWATKDGVTWTQVDNSFGPIGRTFGLAAISGKIAVIGTSADVIGLRVPGWALIGASPNAAVARGATVTFNNQIWGLDGDANRTVVASPDGAAWAANGSLPYRQGSAACAHNTIVVVTGGAFSAETQDVYVSTDGRNWSHSAAPWPARYGHCMVSDGNHITLFGGRTMTGTFYQDCWVSNDGVNWTPQGTAPGVVNGAAAVVGVQLCVIDGASRQVSWNDGTRWLPPETAPWASRLFPGVAVIGGVLYLVGGYSGSSHYRDLWSATGRGTWTQLPGAPWSGARDGAGCGALDGQVIVFGGDTGGGASPEVYSYAPG
jgi:hypothetical protein